MAKDFTNNITSYWIAIRASDIHFLGHIRHLQNIKMAAKNEWIYLRDVLLNQVESIAVQQIPNKTIYYEKDMYLFEYNQILPAKRLPTDLLWTPIDLAIPVSLPPFNHNFFGVKEKIDLRVEPIAQEQKTTALLTTFDDAKNYVNSAPAIRLAAIEWLVIQKKIFLIGEPVLPIKGDSYWKFENHFLPAGYHFNFPVLINSFNRRFQTDDELFFLWQKDSSFIQIKKQSLKKMSISSFRLTQKYSTII